MPRSWEGRSTSRPRATWTACAVPSWPSVLPPRVSTLVRSLTQRLSPTLVRVLAVMAASAALQPSSASSLLAQSADTTDLAIRTTGPAVALPGSTVRFDIVVSNLGPGTGTQIVVTDTIPATAQFVRASAGGSRSGNVVTWPAVPSHDFGDPDLTYWVEVVLPLAGPGGGGIPVFNAATVSASSHDPNPGNNYDRHRTTVEGIPPDLWIDKQGPDSVGSGDVVVYTLTARNLSVQAAFDVVVSDSLPPGGRFLSATGGITPVGRLLTWPAIPILRDTDPPVVYTVRYEAPQAPATLTNVARVTHRDPPEVNFSNNRDTQVTRVLDPGRPVLAIDKVGPATIPAGDTADYTITVTNIGNAPAMNVIVSDTLPLAAGFVSWSGGVPIPPANSRVVTWPTIPVLPAGQSRVFTVSATLNAAQNVNRAVARSDSAGPVIDSVVTRVPTPPRQFDLGVSKSGPSTAGLGDTIAYVLTVNHVRGQRSSAGILIDSLPPQLAFVRASGTGTPLLPDSQVVQWQLPALSPGGSTTETVWVEVVGTGMLTDVARVQVSGDDDPSNNRASFVTTVPELDVAVSKSHRGPFTAGGQGVFDVVVTNVGISPTVGDIVVRDDLPAGLASGVSASGPGWNPTMVSASRVVMTYAGTLAPQESAAFQVVVDVDPDARGTYVNAVTVDTPQDSDSTNNRATDSVVVRGEPDIGIQKDTVAPFQDSSIGTFRFTVQNIGSDSTQGPITFRDELPSGLRFRAGSGSWGGRDLVASGGVVSGVYTPRLAPGASTSFTFEVEIDLPPNGPRCLVNRARVDTDGDTNPANNADQIEVCFPGELSIRKAALPTFAHVGDQVDYTLWVGASPGGLLKDVRIEDRLPLGFRYVTGTTRIDGVPAADPTGAPGPLLEFALPEVQGGDTVRVSYRVFLGPGSDAGDGINRVKARSPDADNVPEDSARVEVKRDPFDQEGMILGKVFWNARPVQSGPRGPTDGDLDPRKKDCSCDHLLEQTPGEPGIPGVRVYLQDGTWVLTDSEGQFSFYGLSPRLWVVRVDQASLPDSARLIPLSNRHANDGGSVFVDLKRGELHRADFADGSMRTFVRRDVEARKEEALIRGIGLPDGSRTTATAELDSLGAPGAYRPLLPESTLSDRNAHLPASPGVSEVEDGGGLRARGPQPHSRPQSDELSVQVDGPFWADGVTHVPVRITSTVGRAATVTLEASRSTWLEQEQDLDSVAPGLQIGLSTSGSTFHLISPLEPGAVEIRVSFDQERTRATTVAFAPMLRPIQVSGLVEARLDERSLTDEELGGLFGRDRDRFEDALRTWSTSNDAGDVTAGVRGALLLDGGIDTDHDSLLDTRLTLRVDSEEDERSRLFRDIQPERFYPVYGDAGIRGFGAQSKGRVFGQVTRGSSFLRYGDFTTGLGDFGQTGAQALGQYTRTLNGVLEHFETDRASVDVFASRDRFRQIVDEIPGRGISGPYTLSRADGLIGSERVELVIRDRNQPAVVLRSQRLERFTDYTIEPWTGRIVFKNPIQNYDSEFNSVSIRVSYEVESGGDPYWIYGASGLVRPLSQLELGGSFVQDDGPGGGFDLASVNATIELLEGTYLMGEFARSDSAGVGDGEAGRVELRHFSERFDARLFYLGTDRAFRNPSTAIRRGREEVGARAAYVIADRTQLFGEYLRTEDRFTGRQFEGGRVALDRALGRWMRGQVGYRFGEETPGADDSRPLPPDAINALGARLTLRLPSLPNGSIFGEFEQDVSDADQRRAVLGGDYRILDRARLYGRHEFISSLIGPYGLHPDQEQNNTIFGISADYLPGQSIFSEYRARSAFQGRDAQAAMGLRNLWQVDEGVRLSTTLERLSPLSDGSTEATALTGAIEFTQDSLWKATARAEYYARDGADNVLGSLGYARKLSEEWTFLGNSIFSTLLDGDRGFARTRLGMAYRDTDRNRWNALARYEHHYEQDVLRPDAQDAGLGGVPSTQSAHIFGAHLNYRPDPDVVFRVGWASKVSTLDQDGISSTEGAHLLSARSTVDVTSVFDLGLIGRTLFSGGSRTFALGAEIGAVLTDNFRVAAGYNVFGFRDDHLSAEEHTDRGFYLQLGMKFDESLFGFGPKLFRGMPKCCCECAPPVVEPEIELTVDASADSVGAGDAVSFQVTTSKATDPDADVTESILWDTTVVLGDSSIFAPDSIVPALGSHADTLRIGPDHSHQVWFTVPECTLVGRLDSIWVEGQAGWVVQGSERDSRDRASAVVSPALPRCDIIPPQTPDLAVRVSGPDTAAVRTPITYTVTRAE